MDHRKQQQQQRSPSPRSGGSSGKHGGKGPGSKSGSAGSKKPIKVVYISNPMRVKTSAAGFRALVQELTGRHADPSKYNADDGFDDGGAAQELSLSPEGSAAGSTPEPDAAAPGPAAAGGHPELAAADFGDGEDEGDIFGSQLMDNDYNDYAIFSPSPLYDFPHSNKV